MKFLQDENLAACLKLLKKAEAVVLAQRQIEPSYNDRLLSLTLNNFGCFYKKTKKPRVALKYMLMAL
jgi:phosphoribosyl-dephospho-CoA transferase